jgi:hypothetical protein
MSARAYAEGTTVTAEKTKAEIDTVRIGVSTVEREFLADLVLPNGKTVAYTLESQIEQVMQGASPKLLPEAT